MRGSDVETKIKNAVEHITPDVLDSILERCGETRGNVFVIHPQKKHRRLSRAVAAIAAAFALAVGGVYTGNYLIGNKVDAKIMLDVNPSIEIKINRNGRVLSAEAKNVDAVLVLDGMDLKGTQINVAVSALVGSMLKYGYIHENANSVLLSVEGADIEKSAVLRRDLTESISQHLTMVNGAVLSQHLTGDAEIQRLAWEHQISNGKAALVQKILAENAHLEFADLAGLTVNELNLLVGAKGVQAEGMEIRGSASDRDYIGGEKAAQAALAHAGAAERSAERLRAELDFDDGAFVYEVEFTVDGTDYEYEINAVTGEIISLGEGEWTQDTSGLAPLR